MNYSLLYKPFPLIERLALAIKRKKRFKRLKNTVAKDLKLGHIDSLELLELVKADLGESPVIYDIGSNIGAWTLLAKAIFPKATVYAFEPLALHIEEFNALTKDVDGIKLFPYALGNKKEQLKINVSSFSDASSILPSTALLYEEYKISKVDEVEIEVLRLDDLIAEDKTLKSPTLIKLDIQGYELEALKGAVQLLKVTPFILMEVSFVEYYKGQPLFEEVILFMNEHNFKVKAFGENTPKGTDLLQIDILFSRK